MPLTTQIGTVDHSFPIRRPIGASFPCCFFVMNLSRFGASLCLLSPKTARAIDIFTVRNEYDLRTVRRPGRADFMIKRAVIIAVNLASMLLCYLIGLRHLSVLNLCHENMGAFVERGRNIRDFFPIGRPSWFKIYGPALSNWMHCAFGAFRKIEQK